MTGTGGGGQDGKGREGGGGIDENVGTCTAPRGGEGGQQSGEASDWTAQGYLRGGGTCSNPRQITEGKTRTDVVTKKMWREKRQRGRGESNLTQPTGSSRREGRMERRAPPIRVAREPFNDYYIME